MSKLHIKQVAGPVTGAKSPTGAIPVFDGNLVRWSNAATTGLQIPTGSTLQRPSGAEVTDGLLRYNTDLNKVEIRENGAWSNVLNGIKSVLDLADAPKSYTGAGKQFLRVNAAGTAVEFAPALFSDLADINTTGKGGQLLRVKPDATGVEFIPLPLSNIVSYQFRVNFSGSNPNPADLTAQLPDGWTVTVQTTDDLVITHNLGKRPAGAMVFGLLTSGGTTYRGRIISGTMEMQYDINNLNTCMITNITSTNTGSISGSHCYLQLWFTV